ncbi:hypothetical protein Tco_0461128 [Tanacetum coccineum]
MSCVVFLMDLQLSRSIGYNVRNKSSQDLILPRRKKLRLMLVKAVDLEITFVLLRNFDLRILELKIISIMRWAKASMLKTRRFCGNRNWKFVVGYLIPVTAPESGPSTALKMTVPSTTKEKICKKNDVKARSLLLMALPNEHQLTFNYSESLDSIFNRLQKLVSRLAILGVVTPPEDLNVKFLRSLPSEWDTHVIKRSTGATNDEKNLAFLITTGASSINNINTVNPEVNTGTTKVNTAKYLETSILKIWIIKWNMATTKHPRQEVLSENWIGRSSLREAVLLVMIIKGEVSTAIKWDIFARECSSTKE